jgi:hypothetical protein
MIIGEIIVESTEKPEVIESKGFYEIKIDNGEIIKSNERGIRNYLRTELDMDLVKDLILEFDEDDLLEFMKEILSNINIDTLDEFIKDIQKENNL